MDFNSWPWYPYVYLLLVLYNINHDNLTAKDNWSSRQYLHSGTTGSLFFVPQSDFSGKEFIRVFDNCSSHQIEMNMELEKKLQA